MKTSDTLIAIISCKRDKDKNKAQRETWVKDVEGMDAMFFFGGDTDIQYENEVLLPVKDDYANLSLKVNMALQWALDHGYQTIVKVDSDVYVRPERLALAIRHKPDYSGRLRGPSGNWAHPYASGFTYVLSAKAAKARIELADLSDDAEDRATGNAMAKAKIQCKADYRYVVSSSKRNSISGREGPRVGNDHICAAEFDAEGLHNMHHEWLTLQSLGAPRVAPTGGPYDDICVLVKTFLRNPLLYRCVELIEKHMPGARIVVMDDGKESQEKVLFYADMQRRGHSVGWMAFDSGFGAKSNAAKQYYDRKYVLIFSDDFEANEKVAYDVLCMKRVLEARPTIGVASGRVDDNPYEAFSEERVRPDGMLDVILTPADHSDDKYEYIDSIAYLMCDHTVNYNLVRREALEDAHWNEDFPIGGDHYHFYKQMKDAGWGICYVKGASVSQMEHKASDVDPLYGNARGRARLALPSLFRRHNWATFTGIDGRVDTYESVKDWVEQNTLKHPNLKTSNGRIDKSAIRRAERQQRKDKREERREAFLRASEQLPASGKPNGVRRHGPPRRMAGPRV